MLSHVSNNALVHWFVSSDKDKDLYMSILRSDWHSGSTEEDVDTTLGEVEAKDGEKPEPDDDEGNYQDEEDVGPAKDGEDLDLDEAEVNDQ